MGGFSGHSQRRRYIGPLVTIDRTEVDDRRAAQQAHRPNVRAPMLGDPAVRCDDGVSSGALVVGDGFGYRVSADGGEGRVAGPVEVRGAEAWAESPAAAACPGGIVGSGLSAEQAAGLGGQPFPGGQHVDGGVAEAQSAEVDDCGQPAVADQQVQRGEVGVGPRPGRRPIPVRPEPSPTRRSPGLGPACCVRRSSRLAM